MKIHEYQAKEIVRGFRVPVPEGKVCATPDEAEAIARELLDQPSKSDTVVVKAQIHAGGRGKGGGIKLAKSPDEARQHATAILGMTLVTHQTGPEGRVVKKVLVERGCRVARELYLGVTLDREREAVCLIASAEGGVEIEEVAARHPERIKKLWVDGAVGFMPYQGRRLAYELLRVADGRVEPALVKQVATMARGLYQAFVEKDATLVEVNPLVIDDGGRVLALDAKMTFDDSALFRHPEVEDLRDLDEEDPVEVEARRLGLSYISLEGNIGCLVNGAGLAMATMDIIKLAGGEPANFLDVGGGADKDQVTQAFKILLSDPKVEAVLVNIFGGIMRCDVIARGVVDAAAEVGCKVPLVVRLQGTKVDEGRSILAQSDLSIISVETMEEAASAVVKAARAA